MCMRFDDTMRLRGALRLGWYLSFFLVACHCDISSCVVDWGWVCVTYAHIFFAVD